VFSADLEGKSGDGIELLDAYPAAVRKSFSGMATPMIIGGEDVEAASDSLSCSLFQIAIARRGSRT